MMRIACLWCVVLVSLFAIWSCDSGNATNVQVQKVDAFKPNLPPVPTIPKPTVPEKYPDGSYSIYGARKAIAKTIETQISITAYVAKIYQKPECPEGKSCFTLMPHLFLADEKGEKIEKRYMKLVGYARSFKVMEDQKEKDEKGIKEEPLPDGVYIPPVVWDWREGNQYKITGRFTRQSGEGFMATDGLLEFVERQCLDCPPPEEDEKQADVKPAKKGKKKGK